MHWLTYPCHVSTPGAFPLHRPAYSWSAASTPLNSPHQEQRRGKRGTARRTKFSGVSAPPRSPWHACLSDQSDQGAAHQFLPDLIIGAVVMMGRRHAPALCVVRRTCDGYVAQRNGDDNSDSSDTDPANATERLEHLLNQPANKLCADCGTPDPKWAALPFGAFICIKCSGTHRSLGVHISKVISVNLDEWTDEEVNCLANSGGNATVNTRYEAYLPENYKKPRQDFATEERANFIRKKYELQQFVTDPQFSCPLRKPGADKHHNQQHTGSRHGPFRNSWRKKESEQKGTKKMMDVGMVEFVGLIKVDIIRGMNLAVRDVMSSDPYVTINLGHQSVKTKVIKNTLNPIWNERLMLSIPQPVPPLKLQVFDKDTFSSDDRMGEADVDIQPLISAAREYQNSVITDSSQICTFLASDNSVLIKDSVISIVDGRVEQEITLRLQNVEHGELEIKLECVPLSQ